MGWMVPIMAAAQRKQSEEKLLAELIAKDETLTYEYKILHGYLNAFGKPERLQTVLEEERRAQWELVLKLDDERLVMRRPRRTIQYAAGLETDIDPYRTEVGGHRLATFLTIFIGLLAMGIAMAMVYGSSAVTDIDTGTSVPMIVIAITTIMLVLILAIKRSRR